MVDDKIEKVDRLEGLSRSIMSPEKTTLSEKASEPDMSKDEQIGFHKGSINTLIAERNELLKMVAITEQLVNAHATELSKLGVSMMPPADRN